MSVQLTELITHATKCLKDLELVDETIKDYQYMAFNPLNCQTKCNVTE